MKDSGWIVFVKADPNKAYGAKRFCGNETFWGYKHGAAIGYVQATFKGSGKGTLNFGNCRPTARFWKSSSNDEKVAAVIK